MVALQGSVMKDQFGQLAGHVVECESVEDVRKFKVRERERERERELPVGL